MLRCVGTLYHLENHKINALKHPITSKNPKSMCWGVETPYHIKNPEIGVLRDVGTPLPSRKSK